MNDRTLQRVLLVEDDQDIRTVAAMVLERLGGFEVTACSSGREALERAPDLLPDLVLLDVMMPELDGPDTLKAIRRIPGLADTAVVFMTAKAQPDEVAEYRRLGAIDVIVKPFDPVQLSNTIREIWHRHRSPAGS